MVEGTKIAEGGSEGSEAMGGTRKIRPCRHVVGLEQRKCDTRSLMMSEAELPAQCPGLSLIPLCITGNGEVESEG